MFVINVACTVCLQKDIINTETYSAKNCYSVKQILSTIISKCGSVQGQLNDDQPQVICSFCKLKQELLRLHRFIVLLESSNQILKANRKVYRIKQEMDIEYDDHYVDKFNIEKDIRCYNDSFVDTNIKNEDGNLSDTLDTIKCEVEFTETAVHIAYANNYEAEEMEFHENMVFGDERNKEECTGEENLTNEINTKEQFIASDSNYSSQQFDGEDIECKICHKTFLTISGLKRHVIGHTGEKQFVCNVCTRAFLRKSDLKQHILTHTGEKPYTCTICIKSFLLKSNLKRHYMSHTKEELLQLDLCSEILGKLVSQEKHHVCNLCDKSFLSLANLKRHLMFHTGEKPFTCHFCGKTFVLKIDLNRHLMTHTNEKPFKCETCDKAYSLKKHLKRHMDSHKHRDDFVCNICKERFRTRPDLKTHKLKHSDNFLKRKVHKNLSPSECDMNVNNFNCDANVALKCASTYKKPQTFVDSQEEPFKCNVCHEEFGLKSQLEVHINSHNGGKPFVCRLCPKKYWEMNDLKRHMCTPSNI